MEFRRSSILRVALPLKSLVSRFLYLSLFIAAFGVMLLGKIDSQKIETITAELADIFVPLMSAISQPIDTIHSAIQSGRDLISIREQNYMLLQENLRLKQWQQVARKL
jgi:rod shape-determining protein MreC